MSDTIFPGSRPGPRTRALAAAESAHAEAPGPDVSPGSPPRPTPAPSHYVASSPATGDAGKFKPDEPEDPSPSPNQPAEPANHECSELAFSLLVSADALARAATLVSAPPSSLDPAAKAQIAELQTMLRAFQQARVAGTSQASAKETQAIALAGRLREKLDAESAAHKTTRDQLEELGFFADAESARADAEAERADRLETLNAENRTIMQRLATSTPTTVQTPHLGESGGGGIKIPDPPAFSRGRPQYRIFRAKLQEKLRGDAAKFRDHDHRVAYAMGFLEDEAYAIAQALREAGTLRTTDDLLALLDGTYEDPDRKGTAERELRNLRQGSSDFTAHYARFQALMAILGWVGDAKLSALRQSLSYDLREALSRSLAPAGETFDEYVHRVKGLDGQIRQFAAETRTHGRPGQQRPGNPQTAPAAPSAAGGTGSGPRGPLPPEERARRLAEQLCLYCGDGDHQARDCPKARSRPPNQRPSRPRVAMAATATEVPDESHLSGKDLA